MDFSITYKVSQTEVSKFFQQPLCFNKVKDDLEVKTVTTTNNGSVQFQKDLQENKRFETDFVSSIMYDGFLFQPAALTTTNDDARFDVKVQWNIDEFTYFEVKNDKLAHKTGNIAVEFESWGKYSGIATTKANYWVQKVEGYFLVFEVKKLQEFIKATNPRRVWGGDSNKSKMFLLKVRDIVPILHCLVPAK